MDLLDEQGRQVHGERAHDLGRSLREARVSDSKPIASVEEYYQLLEELQEMLRKGHDLKSDPRAVELETLLDEYEKRCFPVSSEPVRSGGRF